MVRCKVLVVDDEESVLEFMKDVIQDAGFQSVPARDGAEALGKLNKETFDVLLTDISMPGISGLDLIHLARNLQPSIVPIVFTGRGTIEIAGQAIEEGALALLVKPFCQRELMEAIRKAKEQHRRFQESLGVPYVVGLARLTEHLVAGGDPEAVLKVALEVAVAGTGATQGFIGVAGEDGSLRLLASMNLPSERWPGAEQKLRKHLEGCLMVDGEWMVVDRLPLKADILSMPLFEDGALQHPDDEQTPTGKSIAFPIKSQDSPLGVLTLGGKEEGFSASELKFLSVVAGEIALWLELSKRAPHGP